MATPDERIGLLDVDLALLSGMLLASPWVLGELKMMCLSFTISKIMKDFYIIVLSASVPEKTVDHSLLL